MTQNGAYEALEQTLVTCPMADVSDWFTRLRENGWRVINLSWPNVHTAYMIAERPTRKPD
jgi:hypothetical protein